MDDIERIDALFAVAKKHGYRVGTIHVYCEGGVTLEGLTPLPPDPEEEALAEARANRVRTKEKLDEDRHLLGVR